MSPLSPPSPEERNVLLSDDLLLLESFLISSESSGKMHRQVQKVPFSHVDVEANVILGHVAYSSCAALYSSVKRGQSRTYLHRNLGEQNKIFHVSPQHWACHRGSLQHAFEHYHICQQPGGPG